MVEPTDASEPETAPLEAPELCPGQRVLLQDRGEHYGPYAVIAVHPGEVWIRRLSGESVHKVTPDALTPAD